MTTRPRLHQRAALADERGARRVVVREQDDGTTRARWCYGFTPRSAWARPLLWLVVRLLWAGYMRSAIERAGSAVVAPHSQPAAGSLSA